MISSSFQVSTSNNINDKDHFLINSNNVIVSRNCGNINVVVLLHFFWSRPSLDQVPPQPFRHWPLLTSFLTGFMWGFSPFSSIVRIVCLSLIMYFLQSGFLFVQPVAKISWSIKLKGKEGTEETLRDDYFSIPLYSLFSHTSSPT